MTNSPRPQGFPDKLADLERRLYVLEKRAKLVSPFPDSAILLNFAGPWATVVPPGPTSGASFSCRGGILRAMATGSLFHGTGGALGTIEVYLDGALVSEMNLYINPANTHFVLNPGTFEVPVTAGTHYLYYRTTAGTSDANDLGSMFAVVTDS